jgi:hypothetical protein
MIVIEAWWNGCERGKREWADAIVTEMEKYQGVDVEMVLMVEVSVQERRGEL